MRCAQHSIPVFSGLGLETGGGQAFDGPWGCGGLIGNTMREMIPAIYEIAGRY